MSDDLGLNNTSEAKTNEHNFLSSRQKIKSARLPNIG
jgi:hypothetical protein